MNNLTLQQKVIIINNFESDKPENAQKVCLISNKDRQKGKYNPKYTKISIAQQQIERQIDIIDTMIISSNAKKKKQEKKLAFLQKIGRK